MVAIFSDRYALDVMRLTIYSVIILASLFVDGCGGSDCDPLDGNYELAAFETSGTCGPLGSSVVEYRGGVQIDRDPECMRERTGGDLCDYDSRSTCPWRDEAGAVMGRLETVGTIHRDSRGATGTAQVCVYDLGGAQVCCSVYELELTRL